MARRLFAASPSLSHRSQSASSGAREPAHSPERASNPASGKTGERSPSVLDRTTTATDPEEEALIGEIESILDVFSDPYMNRNLIFGIVELLFVRLMPEIGDKGIRELLEERGVAV